MFWNFICAAVLNENPLGLKLLTLTQRCSWLKFCTFLKNCFSDTQCRAIELKKLKCYHKALEATADSVLQAFSAGSLLNVYLLVHSLLNYSFSFPYENSSRVQQPLLNIFWNLNTLWPYVLTTKLDYCSLATFHKSWHEILRLLQGQQNMLLVKTSVFTLPSCESSAKKKLPSCILQKVVQKMGKGIAFPSL